MISKENITIRNSLSSTLHGKIKFSLAKKNDRIVRNDIKPKECLIFLKICWVNWIIKN